MLITEFEGAREVSIIEYTKITVGLLEAYFFVSLMYSICKYKTFVIFYFTSNLPINTCTCMYDFVGYVIYKRRNIC